MRVSELEPLSTAQETHQSLGRCNDNKYLKKLEDCSVKRHLKLLINDMLKYSEANNGK